MSAGISCRSGICSSVSALTPAPAPMACCVCACSVIPRPVSEMRAACGVAFTPSLAQGSKMSGTGQRSGEISSHASGVGEESLTHLLCVSLHHISPFFSP